MKLAPEQEAAVQMILDHPISILTGGPGTGKTTTIKTAIEALHARNQTVTLLAPTGKAAVRASQQSGHPAGTIHRILAIREDGFAQAPLTTHVAVFDEASMIDVWLFAAALSGLPPQTKIVLVGDVNQLPSVGPGRLLADLIESNTIPTTHLTRIFRTAEDSPIPHLAAAIRNNEPIATSFPNTKPARLLTSPIQCIQTKNDTETLAFLRGALSVELPSKGYDLDDIQVLSPQRSGLLGIESLNTVLKNDLNPSDELRSIDYGRYKVSPGDPVIHTVNNYELEVMNGEAGRVNNFTVDGGASITIGAESVLYKKKELDELSLAYALTVHKSQGSEYPCVVIPLSKEHKFMWTRALLYTAVTRASEAIILLGDLTLLESASANLRDITRTTLLKSLL